MENAFGMLCQRFQIYQRTMHLKPEKADAVIKATVALHNFFTEGDDQLLQTVQRRETQMRQEEEAGRVPPREEQPTFPSFGVLHPTDKRNAPNPAKATRDYLRDYFADPNCGGVSWQRRSAFIGAYEDMITED